MRASVRLATRADIPVIVAMGERFYPRSQHAVLIDYCPDSAALMAAHVIDNGFLLIAEAGGEAVGMLGFIVAPFALNLKFKTATEVMWWVDDDARSTGAGLLLMRRAKSEASERGACIQTMSTLSSTPGQVGDLLVRSGFRHIESTYMAEV
ncbi:GNAT family N-acetyltransferase [Xanthomonas rydalmerensis]|uniref:GNAT family N-acetyltransferase n=1 Tax=Xanthomonas rydalmerensis TaxID=3046274 RepID=A0ABZ0JNX0_9XANT|nr:GNAT family N-acetyltransferase [Xanthomonas sp. DM-2023]WOS40679.1 GNAT family N-acetyltransferase [Xanthomonas sp. DM-2023]WOS44863.1 GNAT family N-acetyltransferase [Xanthomonas sp. DM-2023]WOS49043.1 GNAT family N-acetyltransferase [Xanthomonas sp. DM-2023]WOS53223.1 GNAT family N-acetyltransferase [Xanthomonas sp. DM-2023]WOS57406.1 GNAT family N-acetyltransferase [Xanthomonas sp. DM-2023]